MWLALGGWLTRNSPMDDNPAHALLRDALALINDRPNFSLRGDAHASSYRLAGRIEAYLALQAAGEALPVIATATVQPSEALREPRAGDGISKPGDDDDGRA